MNAARVTSVDLVQTKYRVRRLCGAQDNVNGNPGADIDVSIVGNANTGIVTGTNH